MAINPIPVTYHVNAEARPELTGALNRPARPYRLIVQGVGVLAIVGAATGIFVSGMVKPPKPGAPPAPAPLASAQPPSFPVWRPQPGLANADRAPPGVDRTPVASIPESDGSRRPAFAPVERAPDYTGFKVIAGE